jgi:hypothetical protein
MEEIKKLVDFINSTCPKTKYLSLGEWKDLLTDNFPNWKSLLKDPDNLPFIENIQFLEHYNYLYKIPLDEIGTGLVNRWFYSEEEGKRGCTREWLRSFALDPTPGIWRELREEAKEYVIHYTFETWPGEPYEFYKGLYDFYKGLYYFYKYIEYIKHQMEDHFLLERFYPQLFQSVLVLGGYIPSSQILQLRSVVQRANDEESSKIIEDMIKERKEAIEKYISLYQSLADKVSMIPYIPTRDERELIARVMDKFRRNGYLVSALPPIYLSFEAPPLFVAYPELEDEELGIEYMGEERLQRNRERGKPEFISIEEVAGFYSPDNRHIILYERGIKWWARRRNLDEELLRSVVLIHEIGHWLTHLLPKPDIPTWPTELYKLTSEEVHEGWAQLITWWIVDEIGGKIKQVFEDSNISQSPPYHVYEKLKSKPIKSVINSLDMLRQLPWPAEISDWNRLIE